jgi:hypothetical protein
MGGEKDRRREGREEREDETNTHLECTVKKLSIQLGGFD